VKRRLAERRQRVAGLDPATRALDTVPESRRLISSSKSAVGDDLGVIAFGTGSRRGIMR